MKTVKDLRNELEEFPDDAFVIIASDEEGNSFRHLDLVEGDYWSDNSTYGEVDILMHEDDFEDEDEDNHQVLNSTVVIWPL